MFYHVVGLLNIPAYDLSVCTGVDLKATCYNPITIPPYATAEIPLNFVADFVNNHVMLIIDTATLKKKDIHVVNCASLVTNKCGGKVKVPLRNTGEQDFIINDGDSIGTGIILHLPIFEINNPEITENV